jgi:hypothetical protein
MDSFFEELQHVFYNFSKYCMKILEDSNAENVEDMFSKQKMVMNADIKLALIMVTE